MSHEPIYERVRDLFEHGVPDLERDAARVLGHLPHRHATSPAQPPRAILAAQPLHDHTPEEPVSNLLDTIRSDFEEGVNAIKDWADTIGGHVPTLLDKAAKYENSPVVQSLERAALGPAGEKLVADFVDRIASFGQELLGQPAQAAPAAGEPSADAAVTEPAATQPDAASGQPAQVAS